MSGFLHLFPTLSDYIDILKMQSKKHPMAEEDKNEEAYIMDKAMKKVIKGVEITIQNALL